MGAKSKAEIRQELKARGKWKAFVEIRESLKQEGLKPADAWGKALKAVQSLDVDQADSSIDPPTEDLAAMEVASPALKILRCAKCQTAIKGGIEQDDGRVLCWSCDATEAKKAAEIAQKIEGMEREKAQLEARIRQLEAKVDEALALPPAKKSEMVHHLVSDRERLISEIEDALQWAGEAFSEGINGEAKWTMYEIKESLNEIGGLLPAPVKTWLRQEIDRFAELASVDARAQDRPRAQDVIWSLRRNLRLRLLSSAPDQKPAASEPQTKPIPLSKGTDITIDQIPSCSKPKAIASTSSPLPEMKTYSGRSQYQTFTCPSCLIDWTGEGSECPIDPTGIYVHCPTCWPEFSARSRNTTDTALVFRQRVGKSRSKS